MAGKRILLVDDARDTREFLAEKILIPEGYQVLTAADGIEALGVIQQQPFDLIIADYLMPTMTGLQLLEAIKQHNISTPFILITAEGSETLAVRAMRMGVRDYLIKPFDIDYFLDAVQRVLTDAKAINGERLVNMLREMRDVILVTDEQNRYIFGNYAAQELFGFSSSTPVGTPLHDFIAHPDVIALFEADSNDIRPRYEIEIPDQCILNAHLTYLVDVGRVVVMQDITKLKEADRAKSDFATAISHDLRSPLTAILGYVELLGRVSSLTEQQRKFTENIQFSVHSIKAMLTDMLELNKIETGFHDALQPTTMDIIIRYALETNRTQLETKEQKLHSEIQENLPIVLGNPIRLKQMASNLVQNAIKYTPAGGKIGVRLYADDDFIVFQVSDTGIGIPVEDQPRIWEKFYRTREATAHFDGTGLGLSIVKSIVDAHEGRIWVESVPNEGSTFTVMLPASEKPNSP